eukprot:6099704-Prymnesium_polylepis.1
MRRQLTSDRQVGSNGRVSQSGNRLLLRPSVAARHTTWLRGSDSHSPLTCPARLPKLPASTRSPALPASAAARHAKLCRQRPPPATPPRSRAP